MQVFIIGSPLETAESLSPKHLNNQINEAKIILDALRGAKAWSNYENSITEWCPHCEEEVTLVGEFRVQKCPNCGEDILPCSICSGYNSGCFSCPLMTK